MKPKTELRDWSWTGLKRNSVLQVCVLLLCLRAINGIAQIHTVTNCTEGALRMAVAEGGTVTFACDGTITLTDTIGVGTDTILDGSGHEVTISGGNLVRVLAVDGGVTLTLKDLTIANGLGTDGFASGIFNEGTVIATNCHIVFNQAQGFSGTFVIGADGERGQDCCGGAIYNSGLLNIVDCSLTGNSAIGGDGGFGYSYMWWDRPAYNGGDGGVGYGGAIYNDGFSTISRCTFSSNSVSGGVGGMGGSGNSPGSWVVDGGMGGTGGNGAGSAVFNGGSVNSINSTFAFNSATGGAGGQGGFGSQPFSYRYSAGNGGNGGWGGWSMGAIYDPNGQVCLTNCTSAFNTGIGGKGGAGGYSGGSPSYQSPNGSPGTGFGGFITIGGKLVNTLLAASPPDSNCLGRIIDAGHNISSDNSCAFTNTGSLNNVNPMVGPLADNGGPTLTMALLPGSPAIDAGNTPAAPSTDQRGFPRPVGPSADIGAYELCYIPVLQIGSPQTGTISVLVYGLPGQSCRLLASDTFANWLPIATNLISPSGTTWFQDNSSITQACRFYRVVTP